MVYHYRTQSFITLYLQIDHNIIQSWSPTENQSPTPSLIVIWADYIYPSSLATPHSLSAPLPPLTSSLSLQSKRCTESLFRHISIQKLPSWPVRWNFDDTIIILNKHQALTCRLFQKKKLRRPGRSRTRTILHQRNMTDFRLGITTGQSKVVEYALRS